MPGRQPIRGAVSTPPMVWSAILLVRWAANLGERQTRLGLHSTCTYSDGPHSSDRVGMVTVLSRLEEALRHETRFAHTSAGAPSVSLNQAMVLRNPERRRAALFMCFCVIVVLLLRSWSNLFPLDNQGYGIVVGIVCFLRLRRLSVAQYSSDSGDSGTWRRQ